MVIVMKLNKNVVDQLIKGAEKAYKRGEIPVSAVILDESGKVISKACNNRQKSCNVLGHAEVLAILKAEKKIHDWRLNGYKMVVVLEPCDMCSMVISKCRLDEVLYFVAQKDDSVRSNVNIEKNLIDGYDEEKKYFSDLVLNFFNNMR